MSNRPIKLRKTIRGDRETTTFVKRKLSESKPKPPKPPSFDISNQEVQLFLSVLRPTDRRDVHFSRNERGREIRRLLVENIGKMNTGEFYQLVYKQEESNDAKQNPN